MCNRLVIIGAGGHGKVVADIALKNGYSDIVFVDDGAKGTCMGFSIVGTTEKLACLNDGRTDFVIAVGNNAIRKQIAKQHSLPWATLVHPAVQIGVGVKISSGTVVMAGAVINPCTTIGKHCIINTCSVVEHDNMLSDYVHISPRAALGGTVCIGEETHVGIGSVVRNNIEICKNCIIGAGAVVVKNIEISGIYVGVPARKKGGNDDGVNIDVHNQ